tara:strand:+ start:394 stop:735 length:342 start_codon:yes stop_codon:yes gene_type:complete
MNEEEIQALRDRASAWVANPPNDAHEDDIEDVQLLLAKDNLTPRRIKSLQALIKGSRTQYVISDDEIAVINQHAATIEQIKNDYPSFAMPRDATNQNITKALIKAAKDNQKRA